MIKKRISFIYVFLLFIGILFIFPLLITFTNSFMSSNEITMNYSIKPTIFDITNGISSNFINMKIFPKDFTLEQYLNALIFQPTYLVLMLNSIKITFPILIGNVIVSLFSAFGFVKWKWKHKNKLFMAYVIVMLMPLQSVIVPNYIVADFLGIKDSYLAIILPSIFSPFGTFLLYQALKGYPVENFEAAEIDGANNMQILFHVVIPQIKSSISALILLLFIDYWNLVEQAIIFIKEFYREPLSVYLSRISGENINVLFAVSTIYIVIPLWFLVIGQSDIEKGIELSGIK